jgi:hypothetical protein
MKTESFTKLLRKIIREEVTLAVRKEMRSLLTEEKSDHKKVMKHGLELESMASKPTKQYVKNPMLNDILNETANGGSTIEQDWPTMEFGNNMAQSFKGMMGSNTNTPSVAPTTDIQGKAINTNNKNVATVVNAMTKDYSSLMKAIDKKKGIK